MSGGQWSDLPLRAASGIAMVLIGALAIWLGGNWFLAILTVCAAAAFWECAQLGAADAGGLRDIVLPGAAAAAFVGGYFIGAPTGFVLFSLPAMGLFFLAKQLRGLLLFYAFFILVAALALMGIRLNFGPHMVFFVVGAVIASDVMGYLAGRFFGGPKFWPAVSPKKTWSGTIAGWLGAAVLGLAIAPYLGPAPLPYWLFAALLALAAQMGDLFESALKRKAGIKDSSALLPGHGGILDRFDGLIGASLVFFVIWVAV